jgi:hypothetical protein
VVQQREYHHSKQDVPTLVVQRVVVRPRVDLQS